MNLQIKEESIDNDSSEIVDYYVAMAITLPHGIFWNYDENDNICGIYSHPPYLSDVRLNEIWDQIKLISKTMVSERFKF